MIHDRVVGQDGHRYASTVQNLSSRVAAFGICIYRRVNNLVKGRAEACGQVHQLKLELDSSDRRARANAEPNLNDRSQVVNTHATWYHGGASRQHIQPGIPTTERGPSFTRSGTPSPLGASPAIALSPQCGDMPQWVAQEHWGQ